MPRGRGRLQAPCQQMRRHFLRKLSSATTLSKAGSGLAGVAGSGLNRSDNTYRAYGPYSPLGAYYRLKALQEFGPFVPPIE